MLPQIALVVLNLEDPDHRGDGPSSARRSRWSSRARSTASGVDLFGTPCPASSLRPLSASQVPPPRPSKRAHSSFPLLPGANRGRRRRSAALNRRVFIAGAAADRLGVPQGPCEQGESQKPPSQSLSPSPHAPLCLLRPFVESAPAASLSSVSQIASRSNPLLAACDWRQSEHFLLELRSESRGSPAPDQAVASARVPKLCAHGGVRTRARRGSSPRVL